MPAVPIEVGLFQAPPPLEDPRLEDGMQWNDFINQFSLVADEEALEGQPVDRNRNEVSEATLQPSALADKLDELKISQPHEDNVKFPDSQNHASFNSEDATPPANVPMSAEESVKNESVVPFANDLPWLVLNSLWHFH